MADQRLIPAFLCFADRFFQDNVYNLASSAAPIRTTPYHRRPGYQPQNCGAPIHESVEESLRDAYGVAENWVDKSQRYCCTVSGSDNRVKVWEATELVKVEEVDEDLIFLCRMSLNVEWPKGA